MKFSYLFTAALIAIPTTLSAQDIDPAAPETIVKYLADNGYKALLEADSDGDPVVRSASSGTNFNIYFYGCNGLHKGCDSLNFSTGFDMDNGIPLADLNEWNKHRLVGRAFADDELDPFLDHYIAAKGGLSHETFEAVLGEWVDALGDFEDHIDW